MFKNIPITNIPSQRTMEIANLGDTGSNFCQNKLNRRLYATNAADLQRARQVALSKA